MKAQNKLRLFWKIINYLNKKYCKNKIIIKKIVMYKKYKRGSKFYKGVLGYYLSEEKIIGIKENENIISQIDTLIHEFTHAYQQTFLDKYYENKCNIFLRKKHKKKIGVDKLSAMVFHDKKGGKILNKFLIRISPLFKISFEEK